MKKNIICSFVSICIASLIVVLHAQISLPRFISNGMVLQRDTELKVWGWASANEKVSVAFIDSIYNTQADSSGKWLVKIKAHPFGGPYEMSISGTDTVVLHDILLGDVWLCSGQSNMETPMSRFSWFYALEVKNSENSLIRQFYVPRKYNFSQKQEDVADGKWMAANPENIGTFSIVAYFFANEVFQKYGIPIGLINCAYGGSPVEAWMSETAIKYFPNYLQELEKTRTPGLIEKVQSDDNARISQWLGNLHQKDLGFKEEQHLWTKNPNNLEEWKTVELPAYTNEFDEGKNGVYWFRKTIHLPKSLDGKRGLLILGRIVDSDSVFVNGQFVGTTGYQYPPRRYNIPENVLKEGENVIVVRMISEIKKGGFVPEKVYELRVGENSFNLSGEWQYSMGATMPPLAGRTFFAYKPAGLHNAMISPFVNYSIKGVLWYQGETNADRPSDYYELFTSLIRNWRDEWHTNLPFLYVQLPNYQYSEPNQPENNWPFLRECQLKSLSEPRTSMVVAIDLGEWNDIHPINKKEVGKRLFLAARKIVYNDSVTDYTGPLYESFKIDSNKIVISFSNSNTGLICKGGNMLRNFTIAEKDGKFYSALAQIEDNKVVVWSNEVQHPVAVRYAWKDDPKGINLYNSAGLPASPFRTDNWPLQFK